MARAGTVDRVRDRSGAGAGGAGQGYGTETLRLLVSWLFAATDTNRIVVYNEPGSRCPAVGRAAARQPWTWCH